VAVMRKLVILADALTEDGRARSMVAPPPSRNPAHMKMTGELHTPGVMC